MRAEAKPRRRSRRADPYRPGDALAAAAFTLVTLAAVAGLTRLFTTTAPLAPAAAVALLTHTVCLVAQRLRLPSLVGLLGSATAAAIVVTHTQLVGTARRGLPGRASWHMAEDALRASWTQFAQLKAPVAPQLGFTLTAIAGAWLVAVTTHQLGVRLRLLAEALVPGTVVVVFTAALAGSRHRSVALLAFVAACLFAVGVSRRNERRPAELWLGRSAEPRWHAIAASLAVAVAVSVAALVVAPRLPDADAPGLVDWRHASTPQTRSALSPLVSLRDRLVNQSSTVLFIVGAARPAYWRLTALDDFDGEQWTAKSAVGRTRGRRLRAAFPTPAAHTVELTQTVSVRGLSSIWLPSAYQPTAVERPAGASGDDVRDTIRFDAVAGSLTTTQPSAAGTRYVVRSALPRLTAALLRERSADTTGASASDAVPGDEYLDLPALDDRVTDLAHTITDTAGGRYAKALALQQFFRSGAFTYDLRPPPPRSEAVLADFVLRSRRGYCEHFASAYAAMARAVGLPARVAVGFTPGVVITPGVYEVSGRQAHAWPEVYFDDVGWVGFEPTPGRGDPGAQDYSGVAPQQDAPTAPSPATTTVAAPVTPTTLTPATVPTASTVVGASGTPAVASPHGRRSAARWWWATAVIAALAAIVLLSPLVRARRRRHAALRSGDRERIVETAWSETEEALSWAGAQRAAHESATAFAVRLAETPRRVERAEHERAERRSRLAGTGTADGSDRGADVGRSARDGGEPPQRATVLSAAVTDDVAALAASVDVVRYAPAGTDPGSADDATAPLRIAARVRGDVASRLTRPMRVRRAIGPSHRRRGG